LSAWDAGTDSPNRGVGVRWGQNPRKLIWVAPAFATLAP